MKKMLSILITATLVVSALTACGAKDDASIAVIGGTETAETEASAEEKPTEEVSEDIAARTKFIMGFDANFPPYGYMDEDGEYIGFDIDLAQEVCDRLGLELVKQPIDWDSKDMELSTGSIDCIWNGFTQTKERMDQYTWSDPYVDNSQVFVVSEVSGIAKQADLAGKIVAVQADSSALAALEGEECAELTASFAEMMQIPDYNTAFMNLEMGVVDAVAMDIGVANYQMASRGEGYVILDEYLATEVYAIGFLLGAEELRDAVQEQLDAMVLDGTFNEIATKWDVQDSVILGK